MGLAIPQIGVQILFLQPTVVLFVDGERTQTRGFRGVNEEKTQITKCNPDI